MTVANKHVTRRMLKRHGRPVDLVKYAKVGEDEYGEDYDEVTETVTARVRTDNEQTPSRSHREEGDVQSEADVFVVDSVTGITGGGGSGATDVDVDQDGDAEYVVLTVDDQDNGLIRLGCETL